MSMRRETLRLGGAGPGGTRQSAAAAGDGSAGIGCLTVTYAPRPSDSCFRNPEIPQVPRLPPHGEHRVTLASIARTRIGHFWIDATCIGCGACDHACPGKVDAIYKIEGDFTGRFAIVLEDCIDCGFCVPLCPVDCIHDARQEDIDASTDSGWTKIRELQSWAAARGAVSSDYGTKPDDPWAKLKAMKTNADGPGPTS